MSSTVAIVTGASRGIGRAVAERLGRDGYAVVVNYVGNAAAAADVVAAIEAAGGKALAVQADVSRLTDIERLFDQAQQAFGAPDVVVASAGTGHFAPHALVAEADYDRVFDLNAKGTFFVLQQAARRVRDGGRVIALSTAGTQMPLPAAGLYAASKAAVERFAFSLAKELGARQITVNVVAPGATDTDGLIMDEASIAQIVAQTPLGRLGAPADIADVVGFLAGPDARWMTGQLVNVNGGVL
jgi:3-oxoacyl-[acyl-carrier protein] reductase